MMIRAAMVVLVVAAFSLSGAVLYFGGQEQKADMGETYQTADDNGGDAYTASQDIAYNEQETNSAPNTYTVPVEEDDARTNGDQETDISAIDAMSFVTPAGYHADEEWFGKMNAELGDWKEVSGIDRYVILLPEDIWKRDYANPGAEGRGAPAHLAISFNRNPENLSVRDWLRKKEYISENAPVAYVIDGESGVRFSQFPEMHRSDVVVVPHKQWIVMFYNSYNDVKYPEREFFEQLLSSVQFSK